MNKKARQAQIKQWLTDEVITDQKMLIDAFQKQYQQVITQATISRDFTELGVIKVGADKRYIQADASTLIKASKLKRLLKATFIAMKSQTGQVYLEVQAGSGPAVAQLLTDKKLPMVFAAMPTDNAVMVFIDEKYTAADFIRIIQQLLA